MKTIALHKITKLIALLALLSVVALMWPQSSEARTVIRSGEAVSIGQDQLIEGDLYAAGNVINVAGAITEDALVAGVDVKISGEIEKDLLVFGGTVVVEGVVGDDVRVVGGEVVIAEPVLGDVFVVGSDVTVLPTATITGDLTIIGGVATVEGVVEGKVLGWMETLRIDSAVDGPITVTADTVTLGDKAVVAGDIELTSPNQLVRSQSSTVNGEVFRTDTAAESAGAFNIREYAIWLLIILFAGAVWFLLSKNSLRKVVHHSLTPSVRPAFIGAVAILCAPLVIGVLLVSMLGMLVGLALLSLYALLLVLAFVLLPVVLMQFGYQAFTKNAPPVTILTVVLGTVVFALVSLVPVVGPFVLVGFFVVIFGAIIDLLWKVS